MKGRFPCAAMALFLLISLAACQEAAEDPPTETISRDALLGLYSIYVDCDDESYEYTTTLSAGRAADELIVRDFADFDNLRLELSGNQLIIPTQGDPADYQLSGTGIISGSTLTFTYQAIDDTVYEFECVAVMTRQ